MAPLALSFASVVLSFPCGQCEAAVHPSARCRARGATITDLPAWPSKVEQELVVAEKGSRGEGRKEGARASTDLCVPHPSGQQFSQQKARVHTGDLWLCVALLREFHWPLDFPLLPWLKGVLKLLNPFPVLLLGCKEVLKHSKLGKIYFWCL